MALSRISLSALLPLGLAAAVGVGGCGDGSSSSAGTVPTSSTSSASSSDVPHEAGPPPFRTGTADGGHGHTTRGLGLTDVRTGHGARYDRVVFVLGGRGTPGWYVRYVAHPVAEGTGNPVRLPGRSHLQVVLRGIGLPDDLGIPSYGDDHHRVPGTGTRRVTQIAPGAFNEGDQVAYVGLTGGIRPFRVFTLSHPTRLVIDVRSS